MRINDVQELARLPPLSADEKPVFLGHLHIPQPLFSLTNNLTRRFLNSFRNSLTGTHCSGASTPRSLIAPFAIICATMLGGTPVSRSPAPKHHSGFERKKASTMTVFFRPLRVPFTTAR